MRPVVVASQLDEPYNAAVAAAAPELIIIPVPPGAPANLPPQAEILLGRPFHKAGQPPAARPEGWPFGLKWVQLISAGADLYPDWLSQGPTVTLGRGISSEALAEFALATIFAHAKKIPDVWIGEPGQWRPNTMDMVSGSTLGLVGFGAIGAALAPKALALGMKVVAVRKSDRPLPAGVERVQDLAALFERSNHVVLMAAATDETRCMINDEVLGRSRPGLHLVNVARGSLIDDEALLRALDDSRVAAASLDTAFPEPLPEGHPYYSHPKVRLSPHTSTFTSGMRGAFARKFALNLERYLAGAPLIDRLDSRKGY